ncbi:MAG: DNA recombination protein RmuC [Gemmatimonadales bacterium]
MPEWLGVALCVVIAVLSVLLLRRSGQPDLGLARELADLRARLEAMAGAQQSVPGTVATLTDTVSRQLGESAAAVTDLRDRIGRLTDATTRLEGVGRQVAEVQDLLRVPKLRGILGEVWLEELLRQVFPAGQFEMQHTFRSGERVDAVLRIGGGLVPVDAKFPLEAFQRMLDAESDAAERERRAFRRSLKARIDEIADKYIRPDEGTFEFALMYLPSEAVYYESVVRGEVLDDGRSVLGYAMERRVIPVSPHTFYAYLSAVLHGLKGLRIDERSREIVAELGGLRQQLDKFWTAYDKVGMHLANAAKQYDETGRERERIGARFDRLSRGDEPDPPTLTE